MKPLADEAKQLRAKIAVEREELIQLRARVNAEKGKLQEGTLLLYKPRPLSLFFA